MSNLHQSSAIQEVRRPDFLHWLFSANTWYRPNTSPAVAYHPHGNPPHAVVPQPGGQELLVVLGGKSSLIFGNVYLPLPTCPTPSVALSLALRVWWAKKPLEVFAATTALLLLSAFFMALLSLSSPHSEYTATLAWGASQGLALLFYGGCVIALLCLVGLAMWNFGKGITITKAEPEQKLLGAGELPGIGSDIPIFAFENETPAAFAQRMDAASREAIEGQMVVAVPFRSPYVVAFQKGGDTEAVLSGQSPRWDLAHKKEQCYAEGADVSVETYAEYVEFVRWYADGFEKWATSERMKMSADPFGSLIRLMSRMSAVLLLIFASLSVSAQGNIGKVEAYLGKTRAEMKPRGEVQFVFVGRVITRKADGSKSFVEVLQIPSGVRPFDNNEALGNLLAISNNGAMLEPMNAQPVQPTRAASVAAPVSARPLPENMPEVDSAWVKNGLEEGGRVVEKVFSEAGKMHDVWWESKLCKYMMHIFIAIAGLLRMLANVGYNETRMTQWGPIWGGRAFNIGSAASFILTWFMIVFALVVGVEFYIALYKYEGWAWYYLLLLLWNGWTVVVAVWLLFLWGLEGAIDWAIPEPKMRPTHGGASYPTQDTPRLPQGR
jgi:hypothetical protein